MGKIRPQVFRPALLISTLGWVLIGPGLFAVAQDHTPDPYKPYNAQFDAFSFPTYPNEGYSPNQSILQGRSALRGPNQFQNYLDELEGSVTGFGRRGVGVPYYQAYRKFDADYDRIYKPNAGIDDRFHEEQQARHRKYLEYLRERDPKKRARLYREYTQESQRFSRDLLSPRAFMSRKSSATDGLDEEGLDTRPASPRRKKAPATSTRSSAPSSRPSTLARPGATSPSRSRGPASSNSTGAAPKGSAGTRSAKPKPAEPARSTPSTGESSSR